jgi:hypothetical protein
MVGIVGLDGANMAKKRTVYGFRQKPFSNVIGCDMRIDARLHITEGIDVEIAPAAGNASWT